MKEIKLPVPILINGKPFADVTIRPPTAGVLADMKKSVDTGDPYRALQVYISGCVERIGEIEDRAEVRAAVNLMPYKSAEYAVAQISFLSNADDGIEGIYACPRCHKDKICEQTQDGDTRDRFQDLPVNLTERQFFTVQLKSPVTVHDSENESSGAVASVSMTYPTLAHCSTAQGRVGDKDTMRLQFAIYAEAVNAINETAIEGKWKNRYIMTLFNKMDPADMKAIAREIDSVGVDTEVGKTCSACGKEFKVILNCLDFFASSIQ